MFKTDQEKLSFFIHILENTSSTGKAAVVFVHFKDSREVLEQNLKNHRYFIFRGTWERRNLPEILNSSRNEIFVITTDFLEGLKNSPLYLEKTHYSPVKLYCFAVEHYPVLSRDKLIFNFLQNLPVKL